MCDTVRIVREGKLVALLACPGGFVEPGRSYRVISDSQPTLRRHAQPFKQAQDAFASGDQDEWRDAGDSILDSGYAVYRDKRLLPFRMIGLPCRTELYGADFIRFEMRPAPKPEKFDFAELEEDDIPIDYEDRDDGT